MRYTKPPLGYSAQLALLESRGLTIPDKARALRWLERIGYYRLSGYFIPFKVTGTDRFRAGATFEQITDLYKFDSNLRLLIMQALDRIEIAVRAALTYELAHSLGPFGHTDPRNFSTDFGHRSFMMQIDKEEERSRELFVRHYRLKYSDEYELPLWIATELLSLGALSKMYENLRPSQRKRISGRFKTPEAVLVSWLRSLTAIRNICAHHNRLWNRELTMKPTLLHAWAEAGISNERLYCVALIIQYLLHVTTPNCQWKNRLKGHFNQYPSTDLAAMHFPADWQSIAPWT